MTDRHLYSCHPAGEAFRITKLTHDLDVVSSYLTTRETCDCPAGTRPTCRHRQMLPRFAARGADRGEWYLDYDAGVWIRAGIHDEAGPVPEHVWNDPPPGITMLSLDDPATLFDTIAEAIGEPPISRHPFTRRV